MFRTLASQVDVPFLIIDFSVSEKILRERVLLRSERGSDASDADLAVLEHQLVTREPLQAEELASAFTYNASRPVEDAQHPQSWTPLLRRLSLFAGSTSEQRPKI